MKRVGTPGIIVLVLSLTACGGGPSSGGTLSFPGGLVTLTVPAGAVAADPPIGVTPVAAPPDGIQFAKPVRLTVKYDSAQVPQGTLETPLSLAKVEGTEGQTRDATPDGSTKTVSAGLNGFSSYGAIPTVRAWPFGASGSGSNDGSSAANWASPSAGRVA
jgi:hypothetical protein